MVLQQDKGKNPSPFDTGLPRVQTSEDVPRWLLVLGIVAALTLLIALLRYAIDLLGVVFLIILVGFSIRAISDWLTEGESVSGWALAAVVAGLMGTVMVGLLLFGSRDVTEGYIESRMPSPILVVMNWLEDHGWGQRVLLAGGGGAAPSSGPTVGGGGAPAAPPSGTSSPVSPSNSAGETSDGRAGPRKGGSADEAETAIPSGGSGANRPPHRVAAPPAAPAPVAPAPAPTVAAEPPPAETTPPATPDEAASIATMIVVASSRSPSVVGTSVRFTATVKAVRPGPVSGFVVFYDGNVPIGTVPVRAVPPDGGASVLSTLGLGIGVHEISAEFHGGRGLENSRSASLTQNITRH
jgi:Bacterial Ig-like domain (group 3)